MNLRYFEVFVNDLDVNESHHFYGYTSPPNADKHLHNRRSVVITDRQKGFI